MSSNTYIEIDTSILLHSTDTTFHTLFYIIQQMNLEENIWTANQSNKEQLIKLLSITVPTLDKHICSLKDRSILNNTKRGIYTLNYETLNIGY
jgi:hypothetical protein